MPWRHWPSSHPLWRSVNHPTSPSRPTMHPDAETQILSLAWPLEEPERSAFITAPRRQSRSSDPNAYGPGAVSPPACADMAPVFPSAFRDQPHEPKPGLPPRRRRRDGGADLVRPRRRPGRPRGSRGSGIHQGSSNIPRSLILPFSQASTAIGSPLPKIWKERPTPPDLIRVVARRRRGRAAAGWLSRQHHAGVGSAMAIGSNPLSSTRKSARTALGSRRPQSLDYLVR
jgi:hypothetical protein